MVSEPADLVDENLAPARFQELGLTPAQAREVLRLDEGQEDMALEIHEGDRSSDSFQLFGAAEFDALVLQLRARGLNLAQARALAVNILQGRL